MLRIFSIEHDRTTGSATSQRLVENSDILTQGKSNSMVLKLPKKYSRCEVCNAGLGNIQMDTPLYCTACIEEMEKLSMSPKKYRKYRELRESLGKK